MHQNSSSSSQILEHCARVCVCWRFVLLSLVSESYYYLDAIAACARVCRDISACASHCRDMSACVSHSRDVPECGPHVDLCVPLHTAAAHGSLRAMDVVRLMCHMYIVVELTAVIVSGTGVFVCVRAVSSSLGSVLLRCTLPPSVNRHTCAR